MTTAFPDTEALLIGWLSEQMPDVWVTTDLPEELERVLPVLQVVRIGGGKHQYPWSLGGPLHDNPTCDLDAYGRDREHAADLIQRACTLLPLLRNNTAGGGVITDVVENVGPSWRPDYNPRVRRFGATYEFTIRPA